MNNGFGSLSIPDEVFLNFEKRQQPMHVAGLQLFDYPEGAGSDYVHEQVEFMRQFTRPTGLFEKRIVGYFGKSFWQTDSDFDLEHHLRYHSLPSPGRIRELLSFVSAEHSNLMDRHRPLWECHVIEGLPNNQFALYTKLHHAMADGLSAMRIFNSALTEDSSSTMQPPFWACNNSNESLSAFNHKKNSILRSLSRQASSFPSVFKEIRQQLQSTTTNQNFTSAPETIFNQRITGSRRYAAQSYSLPRIKQLSKSFGITINDIVLVICSSVLRRYLLSQRALPDAPLIAAVPVSLRQDQSIGGNQVGIILANLATNIADPTQRMNKLLHSVEQSKFHFKSLSPEAAQNYTTLMMLPTFANFLTGIIPQWQAFNVIISNVPGPKEPVYWNGAKLTGMYPVSIALNELALNITLTSYCDRLEFGLTACRRSVPSMQRMLDYIDDSIEELEAISGIINHVESPSKSPLMESS